MAILSFKNQGTRDVYMEKILPRPGARFLKTCGLLPIENWTC